MANKINIVYAASEAAPFIKTGGLGDVMSALPCEAAKKNETEVSVFLPYYSKIKNGSTAARFLRSVNVDLAWRKQYAGIFVKETDGGPTYYFIDNEYYFGRDNCYGYYDDGERFAFFSKAVLEVICALGIRPDIIHCNDWQTALIPIFLHSFYQDALGSAKTVFTIHNIEYQGKAEPLFLSDTLGLSDRYADTLTYDGCINFMKGAILSCDALTTVSETYAEEINYPYYAHGLAPVISEHRFKLYGIVNGIDTVLYDPASDRAIFANYDRTDAAAGKTANKAALQEKLGLDVRPDVPVIGMVSRIVAHKGADLLCSALDELMNLDLQLVILGTGDSSYENTLSAYAERNHGKFSVNLFFDPSLASLIYAASDIFLMPSKSEPCGLSQLIAMRYGSIPVVNSTGGLKDTVEAFDCVTGKGTGFTFQSFDRDDMLDALRRCLETYGGQDGSWRRIVDNAMSRDSSWDRSAKKYIALYKKLIQNTQRTVTKG